MKNKVMIVFGHIACFFFVFNILFFSPVSYADEKVATVQKGEAAPFSGTLFNTEAAARLLVDLETNSALCEIECKKQLDEKEAKLMYQYDILKASKDALQLRYDETMVIKNNQIEFLENQVKQPRLHKDLIFVVGVLTGVGITMASAYALNQASN